MKIEHNFGQGFHRAQLCFSIGMKELKSTGNKLQKISSGTS